jgi:hypothetical protein
VESVVLKHEDVGHLQQEWVKTRLCYGCPERCLMYTR